LTGGWRGRRKPPGQHIRLLHLLLIQHLPADAGELLRPAAPPPRPQQPPPSPSSSATSSSSPPPIINHHLIRHLLLRLLHLLPSPPASSSPAGGGCTNLCFYPPPLRLHHHLLFPSPIIIFITYTSPTLSSPPPSSSSSPPADAGEPVSGRHRSQQHLHANGSRLRRLHLLLSATNLDIYTGGEDAEATRNAGNARREKEKIADAGVGNR
jgi:hypothetical protein